MSVITEIETPEDVSVNIDLHPAMRCDRCIGQALVEVEFHGLYLNFCYHHYSVNQEALHEQATEVYFDFNKIDALAARPKVDDEDEDSAVFT